MYGREGRGRGGGGFGPSTAPVKVGDELEVTIEAVGEKGDGIAKKDGFVLFVPGVKEGEHVKIKITKVLRKLGFAEVVGQGEASESSEAPAETSGESSETSEETEDSMQDTEEF